MSRTAFEMADDTIATLLELPAEVFRVATSRTVRRTIVYSVLLVAASAVLYAFAVVGYVGFYMDYVPHQVRTAPVHLQYGTTTHRRLLADALLARRDVPPHPYAIADLRGLGLKPAQAYDVSVSLALPRSPVNVGAGNFMVELVLVSRGTSSSASVSTSHSDAITAAARLPPANPRDFVEADGRRVLFAGARPALLAYTHPLVATAADLATLPYHLLAGAAAAGSPQARLVVPMGDSVTFGTSSTSSGDMPAALYLELRTVDGRALQTYAIEVVFAARLRGLRWLMYHHRVLSFLLLTTAFWLVEVLCMVGAFVAWGAVAGGADEAGSEASGSVSSPSRPASKAEPPESSGVKKEEGGRLLSLSSIPAAPAREDPEEGGDEGPENEDENDDDGDFGHASADKAELLAAPAWGGKSSATTGSLAAETDSPLRQRTTGAA